MFVTKVYLDNFRNYESLELNFDEGMHLFFGNNAQGKTNLIEAIFLAAMGKSFRAGNDNDLIHWKAIEGKIAVFFSNKVAENEVSFILRRNERRESILNRKNVRNREIIGALNAVLFSPEDLWLVKGNPSGRRRFIDFSLSQSDPLYYQNLIKYNRTLIQRNHLLKNINEGLEKRNLLEPWNEQLVSLATKIVWSRIERIELLLKEGNSIHEKITAGAEKISARYFIYGENENRIEKEQYENWYRERIASLCNKDILRGTTDCGPHKDDIEFGINSYDAKLFASQGQQRTIVLALKMAEIEIMHTIKGEYPILLLDDVMSELDEKRKKNLVEAISGKVQTFITGAGELDCLRLVKHNCYHISGGQVYQS